VAQVIRDDLDFSAYYRDNEARVKVRKASVFADELAARFLPGRADSHPGVLLQKLGKDLRFRPSEVTCWSGYNGHRKSTFTGQVALDLCVQRERVLMASLEMAPADTLARMVQQATGVESPAQDTIKHFSKWTDGRLWVFDHMGRIDPRTVLAVLSYFAHELKGTQAFIDSMMMVCASEESMDEQKQFMTDLVRLAQETGLHIHLIAHCRKPGSDGESKPPTKYDLRGSAAISDQAHNVITVWSNKPKKAKLDQNPQDIDALAEPDAAVTVEKQRNGRWEGRAKLWFHEPSMRFLDDRMSPVQPYRLEAA
jgi:twinkle protein